jgi:hypothetical protein
MLDARGEDEVVWDNFLKTLLGFLKIPALTKSGIPGLTKSGIPGLKVENPDRD